jgi:NADH-quinone oxidoreductase subunit D
MHHEEYLIPIGPYHPVLHEPEYFAVTLEGEKVTFVDMNLGYHHRGIEKIATIKGNIYQALFVVERTCGICGHTHTTNFCQAFENILGIEVPLRGLYVRTIMFELERLHSHLLWFAIFAYQIGFETAFMHTMADREIVMDLVEKISGNRVHYSINTIGGSRRDITLAMKDEILGSLKELEKRWKVKSELFRTDPTINKRTENVGILTKEKALKYGVVGPTARGSGVRVDVRKDLPHAVYGEVDFNVITERKGDNHARMLVRMQEIFESIEIIRQCLDQMPSGPINTGMRYLEFKPTETTSFVEAPRGENFHFYKTSKNKLERLRIRVPTYANLFALKEMLVGYSLADIPPTLASIDPCFSCTDRLIVKDLDKGKCNVIKIDDLW